ASGKTFRTPCEVIEAISAAATKRELRGRYKACENHPHGAPWSGDQSSVSSTRPLGPRARRPVGDEGDHRQQSGCESERRGIVNLQDEQSADQRAKQHRGDRERAATDLRAVSAGE